MLAIHNYHSAYKNLPSAMAGSGGGRGPMDSNANRLGGLIALLPFCEGQATWEEISNPQFGRRASYPAMGPVPWNKSYPPWKITLPVFRCPSDAAPAGHPFGITNYVFCIGDNVKSIHQPKPKNDARGIFSPRVFVRFRDTLDGLSNTIAVSEVALKRGRPFEGQFATNMPASIGDSPIECLKTVDAKKPDFYAASIKLSDLGRGGNWADGAGGYSLMQTILPPNSPSCAIGGTAEVDGIYSASSRHEGGCHIGMSDGAVVFITNSIESGDPTAVPPTSVRDAAGAVIESPYGLWGALGTRASRETIAAQSVVLP